MRYRMAGAAAGQPPAGTIGAPQWQRYSSSPEQWQGSWISTRHPHPSWEQLKKIPAE
jgi:hypothetical protein